MRKFMSERRARGRGAEGRIMRAKGGAAGLEREDP